MIALVFTIVVAVLMGWSFWVRFIREPPSINDPKDPLFPLLPEYDEARRKWLERH